MFFRNFFLVLLFAVFFVAFAFAGPAVTSSTHPNQDSWYKNNAPVFEVEGGGSSYSYVFDALPGTEPATVQGGMTFITSDSTIPFFNKASGVFYFHFVPEHTQLHQVLF